VPSLIGRCGGGGAGGLTRFNGTYTGNNSNVGAGGFGLVTWDTLVRGDATLDLTTPSAPTVTRTGYWAFTIDLSLALPGLTAGKSYTAQFDAADSDATGSEALCDGESALGTALNPTPPISFGATVWLTSGSPLSLSVVNNDAVARDFVLVQAVAAFLGGT
jgi:hypothetical protein